MRKIVIDDTTGIVENYIEADATFSLTGKTLIEDLGQAKVGDIYDGTNFTAPTKSVEEIARENKAHNDALEAEMLQADMKIIRALAEGDTARIEAHKLAQAERRAKLK